MPEQNNERRRFHRIATDKPVSVHADGEPHQGTTLDVSLRGLLLSATDGWHPATGTAVQAHIRLDDDDACCINMDGEVAHVDGDHVGIHVTGCDLESATRLRRMVELNLGDETLIERDLAELIAK